MVEWFVKAVPEDTASRKRIMIFAGAGVAAVALLGSVWSFATGGSAEEPVAAPTVSVTTTATDVTLFVHVVGAVEEPGVYEVPANSRVMDAISLAGGLTSDADPASLNLARLVQDGEQVLVGAKGSRSARAAQSSPAVNINTAQASDFESLPRIGATLAERIVAFRDANGPFASVEGLLEVPGIGDLTLSGMRDKITV